MRRKNASTITFGNGFKIFVPFPLLFFFWFFVALFKASK
nr:MAG TPA: Poxvirus T4 protein, N terminus [Caudoviricetes sp.]